MLIVLPAAGASLVGVITYFFAREAKGHGVPEVMYAIASRDGKIRPRVAGAKAVASALPIGSGGSAGTEGPIIQIGAALGSSLGQLFRFGKHDLPVLVGCGAAAGISAIFHAPIAGVLFALEIFLRELNFRTFSPVLMASVLSLVTVKALLGTEGAIFPLIQQEAYRFELYELGNYVILGLICAAGGVFFIRTLYAFEDFFDRLKVHHVLKPVIGAVCLGILGILFLYFFPVGHASQPMIFGNGYPTIGACIGAYLKEGTHSFSLGVGVLILLFFLKTLATSLTLGSGGSGGVFAPSLFLGAVGGYAFGEALQHIGIFSEVQPTTYALVGMASMVSATTHAPMAGIVILFEMTRNYRVILPVMFAATIAAAGARLLFTESISTLKLHRRGIRYESRAHTGLLRRLHVGMIMDPNIVVLYEDLPMKDVVHKAKSLHVNDFIVIDRKGGYRGMITEDDLQSALLYPTAMPILIAGEMAQMNIPTVTPSETLEKVLEKFSRFKVHALPVRSEEDENRFVGMISRAALMQIYQRELQESR